MRKTRTVTDSEDDIDLTPMLDVVFIMLIFFIVTATFVRETGLDVSRSDVTDTPPEPRDNILIIIEEDSDIRIAGRSVDFRAVRANIQRLHAENPAATVVIQANPRSSNKTLVRVMDASRQAGVYDIALAET